MPQTYITLRDFNKPLSPLDRSSREKLNKETIELNDTINDLDLTYIEYFIRHRSNTLSSQWHRDPSLK